MPINYINSLWILWKHLEIKFIHAGNIIFLINNSYIDFCLNFPKTAKFLKA